MLSRKLVSEISATAAAAVILVIGLPCIALPDFDVDVSNEPSQRAPKDAEIVVDLDMSCPRQVVPAELAFKAESFKRPTITISEGEDVRTVSKNCMLTASEYFAARQLMQDEQKLQLRANGTAMRGSVLLDKYTAEHCRNLYVPRQVVAIQDSTHVPTVDFAGELHIAGTYEIIGTAAHPAVKAKRIKLYPGGIVATTSPQIKGLTFASPKIETALIARERDRPEQIVDIIYAKGKSGKKNVDVISGDYKVQKVDVTLVKANDEFIPTEGSESALEVGLYRQERESCQPLQSDAPPGNKSEQKR